MKNTKYIITGSAILSAAIAAFYLFNRLKQRRISKIVADAGYETAEDVYFPLLIGKYANNNLFIKSSSSVNSLLIVFHALVAGNSTVKRLYNWHRPRKTGAFF